ncbi:protein-L-isoaspartate O-methyltransferase [Hyphomicrobium sp. LHD-15]|uniref:protein-L-isoaspartate O-methyltransferase family protein n=1 Tax=Hyphomicrobium sp. LHD-15 TaxID=3072142 RepID=UPI00280EEC73|nr:protein-L-isoaspartate O-methyltransferase [Hyphomicrobium sp. LHD-15]MDQ8700049.1 protein-L-isoaspartate O-methyltransferase [Hyphomicrobium sp. LHD-15]
MDTAIQRKNMVESQVRPSDVTDRRIIRAMLELPRETFVSERARDLAYMDGPVPVGTTGGGRSLLSARVFAKLVQAAQIDPDAAVLDVGAATGYSSAVLAQLAGSVIALEADSALAAIARAKLASEGQKVQVVEGNLADGWSAEGPYDAIVVEGAVQDVPSQLLDQLKDGGRLVAIVGDGKIGRATVWRRDAGTFGHLAIFDATADLLPGFQKAHEFAF